MEEGFDYEEIKQIHEYQKFSRYIDGFSHGYFACFALFILVGICIYFSK